MPQTRDVGSLRSPFAPPCTDRPSPPGLHDGRAMPPRPRDAWASPALAGYAGAPAPADTAAGAAGGSDVDSEEQDRMAAEVEWVDCNKKGKKLFCHHCQSRDDGGGRRHGWYYCWSCVSTVNEVRRFFGKGARAELAPAAGTGPAAVAHPPGARSVPREAASSLSRRLRSLAEAAANLRSEGLLHAAELVDERRRDVSCGAIGATPASTAQAGGAPLRASAQEPPASPRPWERAPPRQTQQSIAEEKQKSGIASRTSSQLRQRHVARALIDL